MINTKLIECFEFLTECHKPWRRLLRKQKLTGQGLKRYHCSGKSKPPSFALKVAEHFSMPPMHTIESTNRHRGTTRI